MTISLDCQTIRIVQVFQKVEYYQKYKNILANHAPKSLKKSSHSLPGCAQTDVLCVCKLYCEYVNAYGAYISDEIHII